MTQTLGIFAKAPVPGMVKTRLAAETSPQFAADVARAFLLDLMDRLHGFPARIVVAYLPTYALQVFEALAKPTVELTAQSDGDLGQRMAGFFQQQFASGSDSVVLIGSDSPTLPVEYISQAFDEFKRADLVVGPSTDGGYYLIGCRPPTPDIFTGIDWSTPRVLEQTIARIGSRKLALLPPWYDVDTLADWHMLKGHVAAPKRTVADLRLPNTRKLFGVV